MPKQTTHLLTGDRIQVSNVLARAQQEGRLVSVASPRVLPSGRVELVAQLRERSRWERTRPWLVVAGKTMAVLAVLAAVLGLVWLVVLAVIEVIALVTALIAWVHAHWVLLVVGALVLAFIAVAGVSGDRCGGLHCRGCRG